MREASEIAAIIREHWPDFAVEQVQAVPHAGWGGDSDAFLVNGRYIFRFPRHADIVHALAVEICLLPRLAPRVGLPIPAFQYVAADRTARDTERTPLFVGYPAIPGEPLTAALFQALVIGHDVTAERMAAQLGAFLSGLHTCPLEVARDCGVPESAHAPVEQITQQYQRAQTLVYPALDAAERTFLDRLFSAFLEDVRQEPWTPVLCHGDLSSDHILVDRSNAGQISGVIDFGDMAIGDPAGDFVWRHEYGAVFFQRVLAHYHAPSGDVEAFARRVTYRHRLMAAGEITYGLKIGNAAYVDEGRRTLRAYVHME